MVKPEKILEPVKFEVFQIIKSVAEELNIPAYIVGGYVRDYLLKQQIREEADIVVVGDSIKFTRRLAKKLNIKNIVLYKRFGTSMLKYKDFTIEIAAARKESYRSNSRKPQVEAATLEEDQKRRDFTINAMMITLYDPNRDFGTFIDPFDGYRDLLLKIIRTPLDPEKTFYDDPLRMMRAIRFATTLDFEIYPETYEGIVKYKDRIKIISQERITEELNKILLADKPSKGFYLLKNTGLLDIIFPELVRLQGVEKCKGKKHKDNFIHTLEVLDNVAKLDKNKNLWLRWAALLHDIAKPITKKCSENGWTFHHHEVIGAKMVPKIFRKLKLPLNEKMRYVKKLVYLHLRPIPLAKDNVTDKAVRRLMIEAGEVFDDLMLLCKADITTKNFAKKNKYLKNIDKVIEHAKNVEEKDKLRNWKPPITGEDIMNYFNLEPSKTVGIIKDKVKTAILEGIIPDEREAAFEYMKKVGKEVLEKQ